MTKSYEIHYDLRTHDDQCLVITDDKVTINGVEIPGVSYVKYEEGMEQRQLIPGQENLLSR